MHLRACRPLPSCRMAVAGIAACLLAAGFAAAAQTPASTPAQTASGNNGKPAEVHPISEADLRRQLQGKTFYLRGGYFDNDLRFDDQGRLTSGSPKVSHNLSMVQIDKVSLSRHKLQLTGIRYGIHFLGASPTEDPVGASDKVRITPKKKELKITIERAEVIKVKEPKKQKVSKEDAKRLSTQKPGTGAAAQPQASSGTTTAETPVYRGMPLTQARADQLLEQAVDRVLAPGLDDRMIAALPDYWQLYYKEAASKTSFKPSDPSALRQSTVDQKARLLTNFEPASNEMAQTAGVAGVALYHVVVGRDGKAAEIAVGRPIGFGLDENAVDSIRKATFQPAMKNGQTVPVWLDMLVEFRIYSNRTAAAGSAGGASAKLAEPEAPSLPGPYTANQPQTKQQ